MVYLHWLQTFTFDAAVLSFERLLLFCRTTIAVLYLPILFGRRRRCINKGSQYKIQIFVLIIPPTST